MDLTILQEFRQDIYSCFLRAQDALFDTIDALIGFPASQVVCRVVALAVFSSVNGPVCMKRSKMGKLIGAVCKRCSSSIFPPQGLESVWS